MISAEKEKKKDSLPLLIYLYILLTYLLYFIGIHIVLFEGRGQKTHHMAMNRNLSQETNHKRHITRTKRQTVRLKKRVEMLHQVSSFSMHCSCSVNDELRWNVSTPVADGSILSISDSSVTHVCVVTTNAIIYSTHPTP